MKQIKFEGDLTRKEWRQVAKDMKQKTIKISKGIPAPSSRGRRPKYPWHEMKIGDSFLIKNDTTFMVGNANTRYAPKRFTSAREKRGIRVWRIE